MFHNAERTAIYGEIALAVAVFFIKPSREIKSRLLLNIVYTGTRVNSITRLKARLANKIVAVQAIFICLSARGDN